MRELELDESYSEIRFPSWRYCFPDAKLLMYFLGKVTNLTHRNTTITESHTRITYCLLSFLRFLLTLQYGDI